MIHQRIDVVEIAGHWRCVYLLIRLRVGRKPNVDLRFRILRMQPGQKGACRFSQCLTLGGTVRPCTFDRPLISLCGIGNTLRLCRPRVYAEVEVNFCDVRALYDDRVVGLRAEAGFRPIRATCHDSEGRAVLDVNGESVVADRGFVVEHAVFDGRGVEFGGSPCGRHCSRRPKRPVGDLP